MRVDPFETFSTRINTNTAREGYWTGSVLIKRCGGRCLYNSWDSQTALVQNHGPMRFFHISAVVIIPDSSLASLVKIPV